MKNDKKPLYPGISNSSKKWHQVIDSIRHSKLSDEHIPSEQVMEDILSSMDTSDLSGMVDEVAQSTAMLKILSSDPRVKRAIRESALDNFPLKSLRKKYGFLEIVKWFFADLFEWARHKLMKDSDVRRISLKPWNRVTVEERQVLVQWLMKKIEKLHIENPSDTTDGMRQWDDANKELRKRADAGDPNAGKTSQIAPDLVNFTEEDYALLSRGANGQSKINLQEVFEKSVKTQQR